MKATEYIKLSLEKGKEWALGGILDMKDAPLTQPAPNGGNHPLWVLGHITYSESDLLDGLILGKPNRFPEWKEIFAMGTTPRVDASFYPAMDEVLEKFEVMRAATLAHLATLTDEDLDKPSNAPREFAEAAGTVALCFNIICSHVNFHAGQVAVARFADGRKPIMG